MPQKLKAGDHVFWDGDESFVWDVTEVDGMEVHIAEGMGGDVVLRHWVDIRSLVVLTEEEYEEFFGDDDDYLDLDDEYGFDPIDPYSGSGSFFDNDIPF